MKKANKEIRNLSILFFMSFMTAGIIAAYLIFNYGPIGTYVGKNTVIAPDVLQQLKFADNRVDSPFKILFDKVEFRVFGKIIPIDQDSYSRFYLLISGDQSLDENNVPLHLFDKQAASIVVYTKPEKVLKGEADSYPFQRIEFSDDGAHYRVQLIGESDSLWAYFKHKGILEKIMKLFPLRTTQNI